MEKLIIEGNAIYELDLECVREKQGKMKGKQSLEDMERSSANDLKKELESNTGILIGTEGRSPSALKHFRSASAAVSTSTAKKQEDNDDPAAVCVSASITSVVASKAIAAGTQKNDDPQDVTSAGTVSKRGQSASTAVVTATVAATTIVASTSRSFLTAAAICSS